MAKRRRKPSNRPRTQQAARSAGTATASRPPGSSTTATPPAEGSARSSTSRRDDARSTGPSQASRNRAERKELARAEREAARKRIARAERARRLAWAGGIGFLIAVGVMFFTRDTSSTRPDQLPGELSTEAPWPANADEAQARSDAIGLPPESPIQMHEHSNLQIFVHGEAQPIPTDIGLDSTATPPFVASLHTHEDSGTIHMESSVVRTFTLGEFFDIWGVRLSPSCMGAYCNAGQDRLQVFVNGEEIRGSIRDVKTTDQDVIVVTYGSSDELPDPIPTSFDFSSVPQ